MDLPMQFSDEVAHIRRDLEGCKSGSIDADTKLLLFVDLINRGRQIFLRNLIKQRTDLLDERLQKLGNAANSIEEAVQEMGTKIERSLLEMPEPSIAGDASTELQNNLIAAMRDIFEPEAARQRHVNSILLEAVKVPEKTSDVKWWKQPFLTTPLGGWIVLTSLLLNFLIGLCLLLLVLKSA